MNQDAVEIIRSTHTNGFQLLAIGLYNMQSVRSDFLNFISNFNGKVFIRTPSILRVKHTTLVWQQLDETISLCQLTIMSVSPYQCFPATSTNPQ